MNKYNFGGINFPSKDDDWIEIEKNALTIALNILYAKKRKYIPFWCFTEIVKASYSFHDSKWNRTTLSCS